MLQATAALGRAEDHMPGGLENVNGDEYNRPPLSRKARRVRRTANDRVMRRIRSKVRQRLFVVNLKELERERKEEERYEAQMV